MLAVQYSAAHSSNLVPAYTSVLPVLTYYASICSRYGGNYHYRYGSGVDYCFVCVLFISGEEINVWATKYVLMMLMQVRTYEAAVINKKQEHEWDSSRVLHNSDELHL